MRVSVCIATHDKPHHLDRALESIVRQKIPFDWELIVADDCSAPETREVCDRYCLQYLRVDRDPGYRNPAAARNVAYRWARGEIIVAQSDDVIHTREDSIERLAGLLSPGRFVVASVVNVDEDGRPYSDQDGRGYGDRLVTYVGPTKRRPLFFLGAVYRKDLYAVGGNDEEFTDPSGEDRWFAACLTQGLGLKPLYTDDVIGHHLHHPHCNPAATRRSQELLTQKLQDAREGRIPWCASGGPWIP